MTAAYNKILVAVDLLPGTEKLIQKAQKFAQSQNGKITLLHVIEPSPITDHMYVDQALFRQQATEEVMEKLHELTPMTENTQPIVAIGTPRHAIINTANELNSDLIIVGSHGKSGVRALLGSTCSAILHQAKRDILVVYYN